MPLDFAKVNGAAIVPQVAALVDDTTVLVNAQAGNDFRLTFTSQIGNSRTIGAPSNPADGQDITFVLTQDSVGSRTVSWASGTGGYSFGAGSAPTLTTTASKTDLVAFKYVAAKTAWLYMGSSLGF